jgi:hypothetical protein
VILVADLRDLNLALIAGRWADKTSAAVFFDVDSLRAGASMPQPTRLLVRTRQRSVSLLCALVLTSAILASASAGASADAGVSCVDYSKIPVALAAGQPPSFSIFGELCATPSELANGETVQLLIHGATYNHSYWDFGTVDGVSYSYARDLAAVGFPTFAIDEAGTGRSSHPLSTDITIQDRRQAVR